MSRWRDDRTLVVLCFFIIFYTGILLIVLAWKPNDGTVWTLFSTILTGFVGALGLHLKGDKTPPAGSTTVTSVEQVTKIPQEPSA